MSRRVAFLRSYLGALGAEDVVITQATDTLVEGIAIYDASDPDERQEFRWRTSEEDAPSQPVQDLATLLRDEQLLDIDRIRVSRNELRTLYSDKYDSCVTAEEFDAILDALELLEIPMVDDGEETDAFFIHE